MRNVQRNWSTSPCTYMYVWLTIGLVRYEIQFCTVEAQIRICCFFCGRWVETTGKALFKCAYIFNLLDFDNLSSNEIYSVFGGNSGCVHVLRKKPLNLTNYTIIYLLHVLKLSHQLPHKTQIEQIERLHSQVFRSQ